jgi:hypothetical protein
MEDSVQVRCTRCKNVFRDRARRLQDGYSRQCPGCEVVLFFNEGTPDQNIKRAMRRAREVRKQLRDAEAQAVAAGRSAVSLPRRFSGRTASEARESETPDAD